LQGTVPGVGNTVDFYGSKGESMSIAALPVWILPPPGVVLLKYEQVASLVAATALPTAPDGAVLVIVAAEGGNARWRADGTDPTGSVGAILWGTVRQPFTSAIYADLVFINYTGSTTVLDLEWYGNAP
jgi:hypothetical protein